ncbi:MAG: response regulator [Deltaproteobacteria bacterium]|nr:response regulator [Deltaproteobacteria bacterium]
MERRHTSTPSSGFTILVVDDQEEIRISTKYLLEREGHSVITADSGSEALSLFRSGMVHLVLGDYLMPQMNGEQLIQEIRKLDEDVKIVLQTGYSGEHPPRDMLKALAIQGYHDKSEGPDRLLLWVDVALKASVQLKKVRAAEHAGENTKLFCNTGEPCSRCTRPTSSRHGYPTWRTLPATGTEISPAMRAAY